MELCITQHISSLPHYHHQTRFQEKPSFLMSRISLPLIKIKSTISLRNPGLFSHSRFSIPETNKRMFVSGLNYFVAALPKAGNSEEIGTIGSVNEKFDGVESMKTDHVVDEAKFVEVEKTEETPPPMSESWREAFDIKLPLNYLQLDIVNTYPILICGSATMVGLWLASAIVGAIDSIPVFPKVMELVGFVFTIWFGSRYLFLKKTRDELSSQIEDLKQKINIGFTDN